MWSVKTPLKLPLKHIYPLRKAFPYNKNIIQRKHSYIHSTNLQGDMVNIDFTTRGLAKGHIFSPWLCDFLFVQHAPVRSSFWSLRSPFLTLLGCCGSSHFRQYKAHHKPCAQYFPGLWSGCSSWRLSLEGCQGFFFLLSASGYCTASVFRRKSHLCSVCSQSLPSGTEECT